MNKLFTREEQKALGIKRLTQLNIYKPYIRQFENHDVVTVFENYGGFYATADNGFEKLESKIKEWEAETGNLVYAATHEILEFGECYSFLFVSQNSEDEEEKIDQEDNIYYPFVYVWNKDYDFCSEYGSICVKSFGGGLKRIG